MTATQSKPSHAWRVAFVLVIVLFAAGLSYQFVWTPFQRRQRIFDSQIHCAGNLRAIGQAMREYASTYGAEPVPSQNWADLLIAERLITPDRLHCVVRRDRMCHIIYVPSELGMPEPAGSKVWFYEPLSAHWGMGACVLYTDGTAVVLQPEAFEKVVTPSASASGNGG